MALMIWNIFRGLSGMRRVLFVIEFCFVIVLAVYTANAIVKINKTNTTETTVTTEKIKNATKDYVCTAEKKTTCEYTVDYSNKIPGHEYVVAVRIYKYVDYHENSKNLLKYLGTVYKYFTPENTYGTLTVEFDVGAIPSERYYAKGEIFDTQLQELYK